MVDAFLVVAPALRRYGDSRMAARGVSYARLKVLHALAQGGTQRMSDLSDTLGVAARTVTSLVDGLEADGLVRRVPHPADRRATLVELTAGGADAGRALMAEYHAGADELFEELSPTDRRHLVASLGRLRAVLERRGLLDEAVGRVRTGCPSHQGAPGCPCGAAS